MSSPLEGIRVIDLTRAMAGPYATMILADLGAEVIKIEHPEGGDVTRGWKPPEIASESAYFLSINKNKKSLAVNFKDERGREIIYKLIKVSDVLIENFRPGVLTKYKLDYESVKDLNPKLIYCSISGYGQTGPYRDKPSFDLSVLAAGGIMSITGEPGGEPVKFGVPIADIGAAMYAVIAILTKLYTRERDGRGGYIDISMFDVQISWLTHQAFYYFATGRDPVRMGSAHPQIVPYQAFKAKDEWIVITVGSEAIWRRFTEAIGRPELADDPRFKTNADRVRNRDILIPILKEIISTKTRDEWLKIFDRYGVPASPVNKVSEALNSPQTKAREMVGYIYDNSRNANIPYINLPIKFSDFKPKVRNPPPKLGQHTVSILKMIGYSDSEIEVLKKDGVIYY